MSVSRYRALEWVCFRLWVWFMSTPCVFHAGTSEFSWYMAEVQEAMPDLASTFKASASWRSLIFHWQTNHRLKTDINGAWRGTALRDPTESHRKGCGVSFFAGRKWRSSNPISYRAHQGCLEAQVSYHGNILSEKSKISTVGACSQDCSFVAVTLIHIPWFLPPG